MKVWNLKTGVSSDENFEDVKNNENICFHPVILFDKVESKVLFNKRTEFKVLSEFFRYDFIYLIRGTQNILLINKKNYFENSFKTYRGIKHSF